MMTIILGLVMGVVFGIALEKSRVMEPGVLIGQFKFTDFTMLKMFLAATVTGLVVIAIMNGFFDVPIHPKGAVIGAAIWGGLLLGAGIVISGACPGTALAQIGAGYKDAWAVVAGGVVGAMVYGYNKAAISAWVGGPDWGKVTFAQYADMPYWQLALVVAAVLVVLLYVLEKVRPWRSDLKG